MEKSKFLKNTLIYFLGNVLTKILTFLLIPLYTNYLKTEDYGYYDLSVSIITLIIPIVFFQIWDGMFRFIYDYKDKNDKQKIVTNGIFIAIIGTVLYLIVIVIAQCFIDINYKFLIFIYGITIGFQYIYGTISRTYERNKLYMVSGVINTLVNLSLNIFLITVLKLNIEALYISQIIGNLIQIIIIELKIKPIKNMNIKDISSSKIKAMVKFSMPIAITTISTWLLTGYTRIVISSSLGMTYNGIFAIASRFSTVITLVVSVLQMSWQETSFSIANEVNKKNYYQNGLQKFFNMITCGTVIIIAATQLIIEYFISAEYMEVVHIMPIVYLYTAFSAFAGFLSTQFLAEKNSKTTFYSVVISAIINVFLVHLLINKYQLMGATISLLISLGINMIIRIYLINKKYSIEIKRKNIIISMITILVSVMLYYTNNKLINLIYLIIAVIISIIIFKKDITFILKKTINVVKEKV